MVSHPNKHSIYAFAQYLPPPEKFGWNEMSLWFWLNTYEEGEQQKKREVSECEHEISSANTRRDAAVHNVVTSSVLRRFYWNDIEIANIMEMWYEFVMSTYSPPHRFRSLASHKHTICGLCSVYILAVCVHIPPSASSERNGKFDLQYDAQQCYFNGGSR